MGTALGAPRGFVPLIPTPPDRGSHRCSPSPSQKLPLPLTCLHLPTLSLHLGIGGCPPLLSYMSSPLLCPLGVSAKHRDGGNFPPWPALKRALLASFISSMSMRFFSGSYIKQNKPLRCFHGAAQTHSRRLHQECKTRPLNSHM